MVKENNDNYLTQVSKFLQNKKKSIYITVKRSKIINQLFFLIFFFNPTKK